MSADYQQIDQNTAICSLCPNDITALWYAGGYDLGISIPDDLSVVGFDHIRMAVYYNSFDNGASLVEQARVPEWQRH